MVSIRLTQLNFETPVTQEFANILDNSAESSQTLSERITTVSVVRVNWLNLEIPVSLVTAESFVNSQESTQTLDETIVSPAHDVLDNIGTSDQTMLEAIVGTPPDVPNVGTVPSAFVGGAGQRREELVSVSESEQLVTEGIREAIASASLSSQSIIGLIHEKRVFSTPVQSAPVSIPPTETVKFGRTEIVPEIVPLESTEMSAEKRRQREEDELVLLGILG